MTKNTNFGKIFCNFVLLSNLQVFLMQICVNGTMDTLTETKYVQEEMLFI